MPAPGSEAKRATAVVTGASAGIGWHLARAFAAGGYDLLLAARRRGRMEELAARLSDAYGADVRAVSIDLTGDGAPGALYREASSGDGPVEVLVNNAGIGTYGPFAETPLEETRRLMRLNMDALTALTRLFLPDMIDRKRGRILNVASTAAFQPGPNMAVYYAAKAYVLSFSQALSGELRETGVSVTALCPGPTRTEFQERAEMEASRLFQRGWVMDPESVAAAGYRGTMAGRRVVVPGLLNKLSAFAVRFLPRFLVLRLVAALNPPGGRKP